MKHGYECWCDACENVRLAEGGVFFRYVELRGITQDHLDRWAEAILVIKDTKQTDHVEVKLVI